MCIFLALSPSFKNLFSAPFKFFSPYFFSLLSSALRLGKDIWRDKKDMKEGILDGRQKEHFVLKCLQTVSGTQNFFFFQNL